MQYGVRIVLCYSLSFSESKLLDFVIQAASYQKDKAEKFKSPWDLGSGITADTSTTFLLIKASYKAILDSRSE